MPWFRVDDKFHSHKKRLRLRVDSPLALWVVAGSYCADLLTDGVVPREWVFHEANEAGASFASKLVEAELWTEHPDGWAFVDWDDRNPSKDEVLADRRATSLVRAEAGRQGGRKSAEIRRSKREANGKQEPSKTKQTGSKDEANGKQNEAKGKPQSQSHSHSLREGEEPAPEGCSAARLRPSVAGATAAPDAMELPQDFLDTCTMRGLPDPRLHVDAFLANARAKGLTFVDWYQALRVWLTRQRGFDAGRRARAALVQPAAVNGPSWADRDEPPELGDWAKEAAHGASRV